MGPKSTNDLSLPAWETEILETEQKGLEKWLACFCIIFLWVFFLIIYYKILYQALEECNILFQLLQQTLIQNK